MISVRALEALKAGKKRSELSQDYVYPRKCAARELLGISDQNLTGEHVLHLYKTKYGRFNLVTSEENRRLIKYTKADLFTTTEEAYANASITLVGPMDLDESGKLRLRLEDTVWNDERSTTDKCLNALTSRKS